MTNVELVIIAIVVLAVAALSLYMLWDDVRDFLDPHGSAERAYRQTGHSPREARARADGLSPWYLAIVSALGLSGILSFFWF